MQLHCTEHPNPRAPPFAGSFRDPLRIGSRVNPPPSSISTPAYLKLESARKRPMSRPLGSISGDSASNQSPDISSKPLASTSGSLSMIDSSGPSSDDSRLLPRPSPPVLGPPYSDQPPGLLSGPASSMSDPSSNRRPQLLSRPISDPTLLNRYRRPPP